MTRVLFMALAGLAALALPATAQTDDQIDVVAQFEIQGPEPSTVGYIFWRMGIAETLVRADREGRLIPALASEWSASADGLAWTFTLRDGVRFHDGTPLTSEAVANALEIARAKPGPQAGLPITAIEAQDRKVVITLSEPQAALPAYLSEYHALILAPASYGPDGAGVAIIGTGPYRLTELTPPLGLEAESFPEYWGEQPAIGKVAYRGVSRVETRALSAEAGDANFVFGLDPASIARLAMSDTVEILSTPVPRTMLLKLNAGLAALSDSRARHALSQAIDRDGIARAILRMDEGADQLFAPALDGWHNDALTPLAYDPEAARATLAELGWLPGPDGILTRGGERFALTLTTYPDRPELPLVASALEQQFRAIGVDVTLNVTNSSEIPAGHADGSLQMGLVARNYGTIPDPVGTIREDFVAGADWGAMGWSDARATELIDGLARGEGGNAERGEVAAILHEQLPVIPIIWFNQTAAVSSDLEGAWIDPFEQSFGLQDLRWAE